MTKPAVKAGFVIAHTTGNAGTSKQLQLLRCVSFLDLFLAGKNFHLTELLVGDADDPDLTCRRQRGLHPPDVHLGVLPRGAMAQVDRKLEHREAVLDEFFAKLGILFPFLFRLGRQVEKHKYPHDAIFRKTFHKVVNRLY